MTRSCGAASVCSTAALPSLEPSSMTSTSAARQLVRANASASPTTRDRLSRSLYAGMTIVSDGAKGIMLALGTMRVASLRAIALVALGFAGAGCRRAHDVEIKGVALKLDQEEKLADQPLSSSTQSVNRYRSVLSRFDHVDLLYDARNQRLRVRFDDKGAPSDLLGYDNVDARFVVPLLPYPHKRTLSPFDKLNLMLAEYSHNNVDLSLQNANSKYDY